MSRHPLENIRQSVGVFCRASEKVDNHYYALAKQCGQAIARRKYRLVYGGGSAGFMGTAAKTTHKRGGPVPGVIPDFLTEIGHLLKEVEQGSRASCC